MLAMYVDAGRSRMCSSGEQQLGKKWQMPRLSHASDAHKVEAKHLELSC